MGREARCLGEFGSWAGEGKLLLETDELVFRGAARLAVPLKQLQVEARDGWLEVEHPGGQARFDLGDAAAKWAHAIRNPRTRVEKLDVKPASRVAIDGVADHEFLEELRQRTPHVAGLEAGGELDLIFLAVDEPGRLRRLLALKDRIAQNGGIWVITPRGQPELAHEPVVAAGKAVGLIDSKSARFSATHTALKLVIPRSQRRR